MEGLQRMAFCHLINEQEGKVNGGGVPPNWLMERVKLCHLERKILMLGVHISKVA